VPLLRNPSFTGRDALLKELHRNLTEGRVALTAVPGMGGVGKTQLALEYAYRHAGEFDLVWWLRAEEPATLLEDFAALAEPLEIGKMGEGELAAVADAVRQALTRCDRWLLVFDNATGPDDVTDFLPRAGVGRVLITSRNPSWPLALPLDVPVLDRNAAIAFLLEQTGHHDCNAADAVANELGDLPLALAQAVAYVTETGVGFADYLDLFRNRRQELWAEERPPAGYPATVGTTMATDRLRAHEPLAVDLLSLCAFLAPEGIPRRLLTEHHSALPEELGAAVVEPLRLNRLVAALRRYSLVEVTGEALSFHRLVQAAARDALEHDDRRSWVTAAVALMCAGFPYDRDDPSTWAPSGALLVHALTAAAHAEETARDLKNARSLLNMSAQYLETRAEYEGAKAGFKRALKLAEQTLGSDDPEVANYVNNVGYLLRLQGDLAGAKTAFQEALVIGEKVYGPDHPQVAIYVNNLGLVLKNLGDLAGARAAYTRALAIDEKSFGPDHPNVAVRVNNLGLVLADLGDLEGARAAAERALAIDENSFGPDHPNVARDMNNLGHVLQHLGDLAGARAAYERALAIDEAVYGPDHPEAAIHVINLGSVLQALGDLTGARAAYERALAIDENSFGPDHPNVATDISNLGSLLRALGDLAGARRAYERALTIDEKSFGADHPNVARDVNNLGSVLQDLGDLAGARAAYERALRIWEKSFGPDHPQVAIYVNNLGSVLQDLGDLAGARAAYERALAIFDRALGPDHPRTRTVRANLDSLSRG
jgi:tetratricopeptide (TPR) repeat protein